MIREELTNDYYSLAQFHSTEVQMLFGDKRLQLALLEGRTGKTTDQSARWWIKLAIPGIDRPSTPYRWTTSPHGESWTGQSRRRKRPSAMGTGWVKGARSNRLAAIGGRAKLRRNECRSIDNSGHKRTIPQGWTNRGSSATTRRHDYRQRRNGSARAEYFAYFWRCIGDIYGV